MTRRFFQFSLGTMLVFVALICVVLAVRSNRQHNRRVAIAKIESLGGEIYTFVDWNEMPKAILGPSTDDDLPELGFLARLLGDDDSTHVFAVIFRDDNRVTDADLANVLPFSEIQVLGFGKNPITDAGLMSLASLPDLVQVLPIGNTNVTDVGIAEFQEATNCHIER